MCLPVGRKPPNILYSVAQHTSHAVTLRLTGMVGRTFRLDEQRYLGRAVAVGSSLFQDKRLQLAGVGAGIYAGSRFSINARLKS
jgi:hypothetical protein